MKTKSDEAHAAASADKDVIAAKTASLLMRGIVQPAPLVMADAATASSASSTRPPRAKSSVVSVSASPTYDYLPV